MKDPESSEPERLARQFRSQAGKVSRQASVALAGRFFVIACGYLFKIYVSRKLGAANLGIYALGMSTAGFFALLAGLGLPEAVARFVAIYRGRGHTGNIRRLLFRSLALLLASSGILGAVMFASRRWIAEAVYDEPDLARYLPFLAVFLVLNTLHGLIGQYLRGHQEVVRRTLITQFLQFPAKILLTLGLFGLGWGLSGYIAAEVGSTLIGLCLLAGAAARLTPAGHVARIAPDPAAKREESSYAASMLGLGIVAYVVGKADILLIGVFLPSDRVGIYTIAVTTASFIPTLLISLNTIFGPMIADLHARRQTALLERLFQTSTKWCLGLTWPLVIVVAFFARDLMGFFGPEFEAGALVLTILAVAQLVNVGVGSVGNLLVMSGHQKLEIRNILLTAVLSVTLNLLLIPRWGMLGAGISLAAVSICANLLRIWMVHRYLKLLPYNRHYLRLVPPAAASALAAFAVRSSSSIETLPALVLTVLALLGAYGAFLLTALIVSLDGDDRIIARAVWEKLARTIHELRSESS